MEDAHWGPVCPECSYPNTIIAGEGTNDFVRWCPSCGSLWAEDTSWIEICNLRREEKRGKK